jgi:integrase
MIHVGPRQTDHDTGNAVPAVPDHQKKKPQREDRFLRPLCRYQDGTNDQGEVLRANLPYRRYSMGEGGAPEDAGLHRRGADGERHRRWVLGLGRPVCTGTTCPWQVDISHGTLDVARSNTENHIIPRWGDTLVSEITAAEVDEWILSLHGKRQLSTGTITKILQTFRTLLDGAVKRAMIRINPAKAVEPLKISHKKRGVLTDEEVRGLLRWPGPFEDYRVYAVNLLAFNTGLRIGEARGLLIEDIKGDHIVIQRSWEEGYGLKEPKFNQVRAIPIPKTTREAITQVIRDFEPERLVFYGKDKETPLSKTYILNGFRNAYVNMRAEADPKTRDLTKEELKTYRKNLLDGLKERGVGFHSWRHKLNTVLRAAGVPDAKIRLLTGHTTARMTDWYTQFLETDMADVTAAQAGLLKER